ncbi:glycosyltransferase family A protein [Gemella sp. 20925_1_85]|uniref:glycosyltransferase family 2 protein n=1 Tax=Gemella sp. 20925_1_85 TaxID=3003690 RepID=UPI00352CC458
MVKTLDRTKDIFLDTMLLGNEILTKKIKTTNKTKITVVLAAYRSVDRLESIVKDIFNQSFQEFEIIVVDDLSDSEIEEAVAVLDNNKINYIKKQLGSNSSAKNCALDFAKGEYVVFVEESSKLKSNYLELLFNEVSQKNLDIAMLTRNGYPSILNETVSSGQTYLIEEIKRLKSDLNYNVTACMFKRKFLDIYNLRFQEDMLALENLYFKLRVFDVAGKVSQVAKVGYKDLQESKSIRNNAMIEASTRRIMIAFNKIEEFKQNKKYEDSLNLLCGYLLFDVLRMQENMSEEIEILDLIKSRKNYFDSDTFINKTMISMSPIMFANHLNRKDRR